MIPAYNQAQYLPEAVESVRWQTYSNWECLIIDDGSTDRTALVGQALAGQDPRIRYHHQENRGLAAARNAGLALSAGKYVQFLDADDAIAPGKLERQTRIMEIDPALGVCYSNYWRFDGDTGERLDRSSARLGMRPLEDFLFLWERGLTIPIHAALFRRELWPDNAPFDTRLRGREDWLMWVDLAVRGAEMSFLDADLAWYRIHDANMVHDRPQMLGWLLEAADLIRARIPAGLRKPFVDETLRYIGLSARAALDGTTMGTAAHNWHEAVAALELLARQVSRRDLTIDPTALSDITDDLRIVGLACRREGLEAEATRCEEALRAIAPLGSAPLGTPLLNAHLDAGPTSMSASAGRSITLPVVVRNDSDVALRNGTFATFALSHRWARASRRRPRLERANPVR